MLVNGVYPAPPIIASEDTRTSPVPILDGELILCRLGRLSQHHHP